jgi:hypothetical protein
MPTKLKTEIVAAAIAGFEEQKKRLNVQIAELRQMLNPSATDGNAPAPKRRRMSAAARARIAAAQRKRWAESRKQTGAASSTAPARKRRKLSAAGAKGDHRSHEAALGGGAKGASAVIRAGIAVGRDYQPSGGAGRKTKAAGARRRKLS